MPPRKLGQGREADLGKLIDKLEAMREEMGGDGEDNCDC